jgi:hypothetical protein
MNGFPTLVHFLILMHFFIGKRNYEWLPYPGTFSDPGAFFHRGTEL